MPERIKVIVIEDEPLAREGLTDFIGELDFLQLIGTCEDAIEATAQMAKLKPDLIFLDIQMPKLTGLDFLKTLHNPPLVILTTAFPSYALQGFELNVVDYLVKPYPFQRFLKAVNKAKSLIDLQQKAEKTSKDNDAYIFIPVEHHLEKIYLKDIIYLEAMENYIQFHCTDKKRLTKMTMKNAESILPTSFIRVHKSFIINEKHLTGIEAGGLRMGETLIPISRKQRQAILDQLTR